MFGTCEWQKLFREFMVGLARKETTPHYMAAKIKKSKVKVKLNDKDKAKDAALVKTQKEERADECKARKEQILHQATSRKYSKDVAAAIEAHEELTAKPKAHLPFTPIVEKELDLELSEKSLADYKADPKKGGSLNGYYINLYEGFTGILKKELKQLKKEK